MWRGFSKESLKGKISYLIFSKKARNGKRVRNYHILNQANILLFTPGCLFLFGNSSAHVRINLCCVRPEIRIDQILWIRIRIRFDQIISRHKQIFFLQKDLLSLMRVHHVLYKFHSVLKDREAQYVFRIQEIPFRIEDFFSQ